MKQFLRKIQYLTLFILFSNYVVAQLPDRSFFVPELSGTLRFGLAKGEQSIWLAEIKDKIEMQKSKDETVYVITHKNWIGEGTIQFFVNELKDTKGIIIRLTASNVPADVKLMWAFGGSSGDTKPVQTIIQPELCKDNVFSIEGNAFTVYYGTSRALKVFQGVVPPISDILLSDARKQETPLKLYSSGKKTDAPALSGSMPLENNKSFYFCFYKQNPAADYNYFLLPSLYENGSVILPNSKEWMKSTPD